MPEDATGGDVAVESAEIEAEPENLDEATDPEETAQADTADDSETTQDDEAEGESKDKEEAEEEFIEYNFGGNKLVVKKGDYPEEAASKMQEFSNNIWSDYTRGKQEVAEQAKAIATDREAVAKIMSLNGDVLQTYSQGLQLRQEIEQLSKVDMQAEWQSDPDRARQLSDLLSSKQAEFQNIVATVNQNELALDAAQQSEIVRRNEEGKAVLDKRIKNFSTEKAPEVVKYAVDAYGMSQEDADQWAANPVVTEMAYKAMLYDRMQAAPKKAKVTPVQAAPVKAMKAAGRSSPATMDPAKMSMSDYAAARNAGKI